MSMTLSSVLALVSTLLVLAIVPGPSDFAVVARSLAFGFPQAVIMVGGIISADVLFIVLVVYGLAELAAGMESVFTLITYGCSGYLIWMGWTALKSALPDRQRESSPSSNSPGAVETAKQTNRSQGKQTGSSSSFLGGLLLTLGEPKALLFYMGFFPAFLDLGSLAIADTLLLMLIIVTIVGGVKLTYAYLANRARLWFENAVWRRRLDLLAGGMLMGIGLLLLGRNLFSVISVTLWS